MGDVLRGEGGGVGVESRDVQGCHLRKISGSPTKAKSGEILGAQHVNSVNAAANNLAAQSILISWVSQATGPQSGNSLGM